MLFEWNEESYLNFWRSQKFHEGKAFISHAEGVFHPKRSFGFHRKRESGCLLLPIALEYSKRGAFAIFYALN